VADFANYNQVLLDMKNAVEAANLGFKRVTIDADDNDFQFQHMPLVDFRIRRAQPELTSQRTYYSAVEVEAEIACFNMTSRALCATIRNDLTNKLQRFFQVNPRFGAFVDSTVVGPVEFEIGETKAQGEFVAAAVATFVVLFYSEQ
jgi:hypothetical protein